MGKLRYAIGEILGFLLVLLLKYRISRPIGKNQVVSIYFHNPSAVLFERCIRFLKHNGFVFIDQNELLKMIQNSGINGQKSAFISFDDGRSGNLKLLPVIEKYKIPVTLFIAVEPIINGNFWWEYVDVIKTLTPDVKTVEDLKKMPNQERMKWVSKAKMVQSLDRSALTRRELMSLRRHPLITIGSHTFHHPITVNCNDKELLSEYMNSKRILEYWMNRPMEALSFPNGDYNERDLFFLKITGYKMAFTTKPNFVDEHSNTLEIPRFSVNDEGGKYENIAKMFGLWQRYIDPLKGRFWGN
jgi:peptidoglycan/xylan/chitin deacetylase (PgdA/CDA1 family)